MSNDDQLLLDVDEPDEEEGAFEYIEEVEDFSRKDEEVTLAEEPLFGALLKRAVRAIDPDDQVLIDFADHVAPRISIELAHETAKGGDFIEYMRQQGMDEEKLKRFSDDQSMRSHLINGLFPVAHVARLLKRWEVARFVHYFDEYTYRMFCAGYVFHDWGKLPKMKERLAAAGLGHSSSITANIPLIENIFREWSTRLGLDTFLEPLGPLEQHLHTLMSIASNTQRTWGTMRNFTALPKLNPARGRQVSLATDLSTLADYLAYLGRTPIDVVRHPSIGGWVETLSDNTARLTYHHVADVRGVLTNLINNAALELYRDDDEEATRVPILYAPTGVVYLEHRGAAPAAPTLEQVADLTIAKIKEQCRTTLEETLTGFQRDGKGLKYAPFYDLFFTPKQFPAVVAKGAYRRTLDKASAASTRYAKMKIVGMVPTGSNVDLPTENAVDMLAEGLALLEKVLNQHVPDLDAQEWILGQLGISNIGPQVTEIPQLGNTGGVPYQWYYAAGVACQLIPLEHEEWRQRLETIAEAASLLLPDTNASSGWDELSSYIQTNVHFETETMSADAVTAQVQQELENYSGARRSKRSTAVCSLCSSAYTITPQREAAILFAPMVYTNKQPLHGSKAIRNICAICEMEMMLRQLLMNHTAAVGKKFEGRRLRYLFFYPTYFFTPETLMVLREIESQIRHLSFTKLRKLFIPTDEKGGLDQTQLDEILEDPLALSKFQRIQDLLLTTPSEPENDRFFRMRFSGNEPMTFAFLGIPPVGRDAKDAEAWVHPAFLALVLPLLLDIKVVASESMLPLFNEASELPETVLFDGPHQFVTYLTGRGRLNLDQLGPALQRLTAAYLIHLDGNAKVGAGGYDYRWKEMPALARDLDTSPLYAFAYLKKWQRRLEIDSFGGSKAALYLRLFDYIAPKGDPNMTHAQELVTRYRQFYRHARGKLNSNAILRPISIVADAVLDADVRLFDTPEALVEAARGRLSSFIDDLEKKRGADGTIPYWIDAAQRQQALLEFCQYFVNNLYDDVFGRDRSALRGKQLNLFKNACEVVYLDAQRREWAERNETPEEREATIEEV